MRVPFFRRGSDDEERTSYPLALQDWANLNAFPYNGTYYPLRQTLINGTESVTDNFEGLIQGAYQSNGIVFACMLTRMLHFVQARFQFQQMRNGTPGDLFGTPELSLLENPWLNGTTSDLLQRMIQDVDLAGNFYGVRTEGRIVRLRPDHTFIVLGSSTKNPDWEAGDADTVLIGYQYHPGGAHSGREPVFYYPEQVAHWAPIPDPLAYYRGMSWLTPVIREIQADQSMTTHRQKFFDQGATVNHVATIPAQTVEAFEKWVDKLDANHSGKANAYRTVYLGAGADMKAIGSDMQQIDFKSVQGAGEVRIALAARIPPTILGLSEGLQGSTLNAGNYSSARRNFADGLLYPLWEGAAGALASIIRVPSGARLSYDDRHIPFLKEDVKDSAEIRVADSSTINNLTTAGFDPDAVINAVLSDDFSLLLGKHSGLFSVQLQPPGIGNSGGTSSGGTV